MGPHEVQLRFDAANSVLIADLEWIRYSVRQLLRMDETSFRLTHHLFSRYTDWKQNAFRST